MQPLSPPASPSETSSTPTSSTVVAASGRISSRKSASFRLRERSEIASASRTSRTLGMDDDGRAERQAGERRQRLFSRVQAPALIGEPIDSDDDGRPWIASRSPPPQPAGSRGWLPDSTTMQQPRPQRLPGDLVGDVKAAARASG